MRNIRQVLRLANTTDLSLRAIGRSLSITADSVRNYIIRAQATGTTWPLPDDMDDATLEARLFPSAAIQSARKEAPDWCRVHEELKQKGATLRALHEEHLERNPNGVKLSRFCELYNRWRAGQRSYLRVVHAAGERVFVDYSGATAKVVDPKTGEVRRAQVFVGILGASSYTYAEAHWSQQLHDWMSAHVRMFEFFGGTPQVVVCDNLKSAVKKASKSDPIVNDSYQALASHYSVVVIPTRPYEARDKGCVENAVLIVQRWILFKLRKRIFHSLDELNAAIRELLVRLNDAKFQKRPGTRREAFLRLDLPALKPLPIEPYVYREFRLAKVGPDKRVQVGDQSYGVPYHLLGQTVTLCVTANMIEVLHGGRRICSLPRKQGPGHDPNPEYLPPNERHWHDWSPQSELDWGATVGPEVHTYLGWLLPELKHKELGYRLGLSLRKMVKQFGADRLNAACNTAMNLGIKTSSSLRSLLVNKLERQPLQADIQEASFTHDNLRGPEHFH